ncbi:MAG: alpha/beta hydrolase [Rhodobacteraceae bacterium]|nr:alpha/beta hydrolase [Paracoccaceae bacterium]
MTHFKYLRRNFVRATLIALCAFAADAETLDIDGRSVAVRMEGNGPPVIFVHGALSDLRAWDAVIDPLARSMPDHLLITYTQRHFGAGEGPLGKPGDFTRETHVADLIRLAETVEGETPATVVTWSYGGEIGLHAIRRRPDLFRAAIHYEPILFPLLKEIPGGERARMEKVRTMFAPAAAIARKGDLEGAAMRFMEGAFAIEAGTASDAPAPWPKIWRDNSRTIPAYGSMVPLSVECADLADITIPTLVIQGSNTHVDTAMMSDQVTACLANATTIRIGGAGHGIPMRNPQRMAEIVAGFLSVLD